MTLPLSGPLEASDINVELGRSATAVMSIKDAATGVYGAINTCSPYYPNATAPHAYSEWYGYNHNAPCLNSNFAYWDDTTTGTQNMLYSFKKDYWTDVSATRPSPLGQMTISFWLKHRITSSGQGYVMGLYQSSSLDRILVQWFSGVDPSVPGKYDALVIFGYTDRVSGYITSVVNLSDTNNSPITGISSTTPWSATNRGSVDTNGYSLITVALDYDEFASVRYAKWYWNDIELEVPWQNTANNTSHTYGDSVTSPSWTNKDFYIGGGFIGEISAKCQLDGFTVFLDSALTSSDVTTVYNGGAVADIADYQAISTNILFYNFESDTPDIGLETGGNYGFDLDEYNTPKRIQNPAA